MCLMVRDAKSLHDVQSSEQEQMMRTIIAFLMQFIREGWICCVLHQSPVRAPEIPRLIDPLWLTTGRHMRACYYGNVVRHDIVLLEMILSKEAQQFLFSFLFYFIRCLLSPVGSRAHRL